MATAGAATGAEARATVGGGAAYTAGGASFCSESKLWNTRVTMTPVKKATTSCVLWSMVEEEGGVFQRRRPAGGGAGEKKKKKKKIGCHWQWSCY